MRARDQSIPALFAATAISLHRAQFLDNLSRSRRLRGELIFATFAALLARSVFGSARKVRVTEPRKISNNLLGGRAAFERARVSHVEVSAKGVLFDLQGKRFEYHRRLARSQVTNTKRIFARIKLSIVFSFYLRFSFYPSLSNDNPQRA